MKDLKKELQEYFVKISEEEKFSGSVLISACGESLICNGYGMANYELEVPNTSKTKHRIGSITKQFTAVAIMQLVERKLISLDDTLDKFIEDYPKGNEVTIHHLLTHSSGIVNYTNLGSFGEIIRKEYSAEGFINDVFKDKPYDFEPGEKFSYSNSGYFLLGYIIEKVTNKSYEEYLQENILDKLELSDSGYDYAYKIIKSRASGYRFRGENKEFVNCDFIDMSIPYAAGSMYSTVEELYKWNKALLGGDILSSESLDKILTKHIKKADNTYYGYGINVSEKELGGKVRKSIHHSGGIPGFLSKNMVFSEEDIHIIMITNVMNGDLLEKAISKVESIIFDKM